MFRGLYRGKSVHGDDSAMILKRATDAGVCQMLLTGTTLESSRQVYEAARENNNNLTGGGISGVLMKSTVGCHPTHCNEIHNSPDPQAYVQELRELAQEGLSSSSPVIGAIGEIGLDYERLEFCPKDLQQKYFQLQLSALIDLQLPLFLHLRGGDDCVSDFLRIIDSVGLGRVKGVVHSFDGSSSTVKQLLDRGLYVGLNFCSMRTEDNIAVIRDCIPIDRMMIETDAPWCDLRPTHPSYKYLTSHSHLHTDNWSPVECVKKEKFKEGAMVKSRNEPCMARHVLRVISSIKNVPEDILAVATFKNSQMFFESSKSGK
jgi:TatD DNase family protein